MSQDSENTGTGEPVDEISWRDRQRESRDRWRTMREEFERQHPELAKVRAGYAGWLVGFLDMDPATGTAEGCPRGGPSRGAEVRWHPGRRYIVRQVHPDPGSIER